MTNLFFCKSFNIFSLPGRCRIKNLCQQTSTLAMSTSNKPKVFMIRSDYPKNTLKILEEKCEVEIWPSDCGSIPRSEFLKRIKGKNALFVDLSQKINMEVLDAAGAGLKVVGTMSVGVDHVDKDALREKGIRLGHTPNVLTEACAEFTVALLLATSRRIFEANRTISKGEWKEWSPLWMCGPALKGSVVGIYGFGRIGQSVAKKLIAFDVAKILYASQVEKEEGKRIGAINTSLENMLHESDFILVTCALSEKTRLIFDETKFSLMKPTAIFINTSRGAVVDQEALIRALQNSQIRAAGLDVMTPEPLPTNHPLLQLENCVTTPHIASATYQARMAMAELTANNIICALDNREMPAEFEL